MIKTRRLEVGRDNVRCRCTDIVAGKYDFLFHIQRDIHKGSPEQRVSSHWWRVSSDTYPKRIYIRL